MSDIILLADHVCLSYSFLLENGIGQKSIEKWSERKADFKYKANGTTYFFYAGIPAPSRSKLPSEAELREMYHRQEYEREEKERSLLKGKLLSAVKPKIDYALEVGYFKLITFYSKQLPSPSKQTRCVLYAKRHAIAEVILSFINKYTLKELHEAYLTIDKSIAKARSYVKFTVAVKKWKQGINFCTEIKEGRGRKQLELTPEAINLIRSVWSHPNQKSYTTVHEKLKKYYEDNGLTGCPSRSKIVGYLMEPEVRSALMKTRNKKLWKRDNNITVHFDKPPHANNLWEIDASPLQIFCWNKTRTQKIRLELTAIIDAFSGYIVGYDLAEKEDFISWKRAIKMAVENTGAVPYELRYDNHGLTKMPDFDYLKSRLLSAGCLFDATKPKSPNEKPEIERWFGTFQTIYQREIDGFIGEDIKSRSPNARVSPEYYSKFEYTYDEMQAIISDKIKEYNQNNREGKVSPESLYRNSGKPNEYAVDVISIPLMFWSFKEVTVRNCEVKITVQKMDYYYLIHDIPTAYKLNTTKVKVFYDEDDLSTVQVFYNDEADSIELRQRPKIYKDKASQHLNDKDALHKEAAKMRAFNKYTDEKLKELLSQNPATNKEDYNNAETQEYLKEGGEYSQKSDLRKKQQKMFQDVKPSLRPINSVG